jgi:hypothetical protein
MVVFELHVGEFNFTFNGVVDQLDYLTGLGVTSERPQQWRGGGASGGPPRGRQAAGIDPPHDLRTEKL